MDLNFNGFGVQKTDLNVTQNRHKYVGGSDVPTIIGINSYKSQYELAKEKIGLTINEFKGNEYTQYGNVLEPQIREYINEVNETAFQEDTFIDEERWIRSNVDGIDYDENLLLEIKTHGKNPKIAVYEAQMQLYMHQSGVETGWLAMYERPTDFDVEFDSERLTIKVIERDEKKINQILDAIETFWIRCEMLKEEPEMDEQEFMTKDTGMENVLMKLNNVAPQIVEMKQQLKEIEKQEKDLKNELYERMYENDIKKIDTPLLTITRVLPSASVRFDSRTFKKDHPELHEKYSKESKRSGYVKLNIKED